MGWGNEDAGQAGTHFAIFGKVYLQCLCIVLEPKRCHGKQYVFAIHRFPLLLLTLFGCCATTSISKEHPVKEEGGEHEPSLVMNEMNSLTHSCMHSLASLAILALSGSAVFMIRATGAKLRMLASDPV